MSCSIFLDLGIDWSAGTIHGRTMPRVTGLCRRRARRSRSRPPASASSITTGPEGALAAAAGRPQRGASTSMRCSRPPRTTSRPGCWPTPRSSSSTASRPISRSSPEIPYQELTQTSGGGNIGTTKFKDVGVELMVTPQVTRDGQDPPDAQTRRSASRPAPCPWPSRRAGSRISSPQPIVDKREAQTFALIRDGQTVVIGGLQEARCRPGNLQGARCWPTSRCSASCSSSGATRRSTAS